MRNRMEEIKAKGFDIYAGDKNNIDPEPIYPNRTPIFDYSKMRVGAKTLSDATLNLGDLKKANPRLATKSEVLRAINNYDLVKMREISNFFYKTSGIYNRILRYMAFMYRYDWFVSTYINDKSYKKDKIAEGFDKSLKILDNYKVKKNLGEIALNVLRNGAYYGYKIKKGDSFVLQDLDANYCRSRFEQNGKAAIEFNMKFFDDYFSNSTQRERILKIFPADFARGYRLYKTGKLPPQFQGDSQGWYLLNVKDTVRFTANGEEYPAFISVIPLILDLDEAQALDRKKTMQKLLKIVIQKMPLDKNGDLIFDVDEAQILHNNAVRMLGRAIGVDVLTTFADVTVEDMTDDKASTQTDDLQRVERQLYNEAGVSQMQFNTDGNIALEKSILNDAATMKSLVLQFEDFLNELIEECNKNKKKVEYTVEILPTTIYNYQELAKIYKEQTTIGYSKMLPQIALGQSQRSILANAYFENEVLDLANVFIPPMQSSTMNADALQKIKGRGNKSDEKQTGRPEKPDEEKSTKTLQNRESMS